MMGDWFILTLAQARKLKRRFIQWGEFPRKGMHVGQGRHANMPESWAGDGVSVPVGWSDFPVPILKLADEYAVQINQELKDIWNRHKDTLTQAERDFVSNKIATAGPLDASWNNAIRITIPPE